MMNAPIDLRTSNFAAATLLSAALIVSALIIAHKSVVPPLNSPIPAVAKAAPPIAQDSVKGQFRDQLLAAPTIHTYQHNHKTYTLSDIKVQQVIYIAKDDQFLIRFEWVWQQGRPYAQPWTDATTLYNDGYGHYYGTAVLSSIQSGTGQNADVTIK